MTQKQKPVAFLLRLYPGQDDDLIAWLAQSDAKPYGAKSQAVKEALRRGIRTENTPAPNAVGLARYASQVFGE